MDKNDSFETKMKRLEEIVNEVENSTLSLEDSMKLYEEGTKLIRELQLSLDNAETKIKEYSTKSNE